jgi:adenosylcobinamide kinase/adenosylcobinamide-phosphate guanylyltransferase
MGRLILVLGGVRSGKSDYAEELAQSLGQAQVLFVATAEAGDAEMARRIAAHQQSRPASWRTLEAPRHIGEAIQSHLGEAAVVLVDCMTLLVSNVMLALGDDPDATQAEQAVQDEIQALLRTCQRSPMTCIAVSNEVGLGVVPEHRLGRLYRDLLGKANQALAAQADEVYLMVAGLAVELKALAAPRKKP